VDGSERRSVTPKGADETTERDGADRRRRVDANDGVVPSDVPTADEDEPSLPFVSIIVPVYEDTDGVVTTIGALLAQTYPSDRHEIVVVDNGSGDDTPAIVEEFATAHDRLRLVVHPGGGSYAARNAGIRASEGSLLSFVDADMWVEPDWLRAVVSRTRESNVDYLGCTVELTGSTGPQSIAERYNRRTAFPIRKYVDEWGFAPTCCLTVRRAVVEDVGPFDERLVSSGDLEFGNRVVDANYDVDYTDDVTMHHPPRTTIAALTNKSRRIGRGRYQLRTYYPERYGSPLVQLANPLNYTPPLPRSMSAHLRGWDELSVRWKVTFTLLGWLLTLSRAAGTLSEALEGSDDASDTMTVEQTETR
jgi:cellulose synthase/poly-beta-1,6-N-acetylglucosamine synthase-like glycosyltransferase